MFDHLPTQTWFFILFTIIYIGLLQPTGQKAACRIYQLSSANWKERWVSLEKGNWLSNANTSHSKEPVFDDIENKIQQLILFPELLTHRCFQDTVVVELWTKADESWQRYHYMPFNILRSNNTPSNYSYYMCWINCHELVPCMWGDKSGFNRQCKCLLWLKQQIYKKHWVWIVAASVVNAVCEWMRCVNAKENTQTNPEPVASEIQKERDTVLYTAQLTLHNQDSSYAITSSVPLMCRTFKLYGCRNSDHLISLWLGLCSDFCRFCLASPPALYSFSLKPLSLSIRFWGGLSSKHPPCKTASGPPTLWPNTSSFGRNPALSWSTWANRWDVKLEPLSDCITLGMPNTEINWVDTLTTAFAVILGSG